MFFIANYLGFFFGGGGGGLLFIKNVKHLMFKENKRILIVIQMKTILFHTEVTHCTNSLFQNVWDYWNVGNFK